MNSNECPDVVEPQEDKQEHPVQKERDPLPLLGVVAAQIQQSQEDPCGQLSPLEQEKIPSEIKERIITSASAAIVAPPLCQKVVTASPQDDPSARKRCLDKARCDAAAGATPTTGSVGQGENGMLERDKDTDFCPAELQDEGMGTPEAEEVLRQADSSALGLPPPDQAGLLVAKGKAWARTWQRRCLRQRPRVVTAATMKQSKTRMNRTRIDMMSLLARLGWHRTRHNVSSQAQQAPASPYVCMCV